MRYLGKALLAVVAVWLICPAFAEDDCRLEIVTSLPFQLDTSGRATVAASIGGQPVRLLVDTGAWGSLLTERAAERLGLTAHAGNLQAKVFGGERLSKSTVVRDFVLGDLKADRSMFLIMQSNHMPDGVDGLIGADFIRRFDVDFDFAGGKINLFKPHRCDGRAVYWTQDQSAIAKISFHRGEKDTSKIVFPVEIDGKKIDAILDTGAYGSVMNLEAAHNLFGIDVNSAGMRAVGDRRYTYPFKSLIFDGVAVNNPRIDMLPRESSKFTDYSILLGISVLRQLHLYIAYKEEKLYVTSASAH